MRHFTSFIALPVALFTVAACSGDATPDEGEPSRAPDGTGVDLPLWERQAGSVAITGASDAVPVSNESVTGMRQPSNVGSTVVCNYEDGILDVFATTDGITSDLELTVRDAAYAEGVLQHYDLANGTEDSAFALQVVLGRDASAEYIYAFGTDAATFPETTSSCSLHVASLTPDSVSGSIACVDLVATEASADYPVTHAPLPRATASLSFDCPFYNASAVEGTGGTNGTGGNESTPSSGGSSGTSTAPSCQGVATSCSQLSESGCYDSVGCSLDGDCSGAPQSCYYQLSSYSCGSQDGCYWSTYSDDCSGVAMSCSTYSTSSGCILQTGCNWQNRCAGVVYGCDSFTERNGCEGQAGCEWR